MSTDVSAQVVSWLSSSFLRYTMLSNELMQALVNISLEFPQSVAGGSHRMALMKTTMTAIFRPVAICNFETPMMGSISM